jgi:dynein heavy chain 2
VLLASAFVCYAGAHAEDVRRTLLADWCAACEVEAGEGGSKHGVSGDGNEGAAGSGGSGGSEGFDVLRFLSTESQLLAWKSAGLPADQLSLENAVILEQLDNSGPVPFVIDPGLRATAWLQKAFVEKAECIAHQVCGAHAHTHTI